MNEIYQKAIELKYEGVSYAKISETIGGELTEGTLKQYFSTNGMLYSPYLEYYSRMNDSAINLALITMKKNALKATEALQEGLDRAIKNKDDRMIIKYASMILNRAGVAEVKSIKEPKQKSYFDCDTYEEFVEKCEAVGIDPETGLRKVSI